ncbi:DNA-binding protein [Stenotrophomonas maltophilia]|uniref:DNA-binding protein n=1 Tax=Stenotrophomonas maltophilia TaxID=40324 RepID=UPI00240D2B53|nr:DNA-binding protein [Stenotrophomonas maltophilia]MDG2510073.1 DNA-binding protein [Stenotrophomonas maltophilia]
MATANEPKRLTPYEPKRLNPQELSELHALPDDAVVTSIEAAAFLRLTPRTLAWSRTQRPESHPPHVVVGSRTIRYRMGDLRAHMKRRGADMEG